MAKGREPAGPTWWVIDSDETWLTVYVSVSQKLGTNGAALLSTHHLRKDAVERTMARYRGENKAEDFPTLLRTARAVLDAAEKSWQLERERQSRSN